MKFVFSSRYRQAMRHAGTWSSRSDPGRELWVHGEHSNVSMRQSQPGPAGVDPFPATRLNMSSDRDLPEPARNRVHAIPASNR